MMKKTNSKTKTVPGPSNLRLQQARRLAGFTSCRSAAVHFDWIESTYASHENGQIPQVPRDAARRYAKAFNLPGLTYLWITDGAGPSPRQRDARAARPDQVASLRQEVAALRLELTVLRAEVDRMKQDAAAAAAMARCAAE